MSSPANGYTRKVLVCALVLSQSLLDHAITKWQATPEMRIEDAYKWLFHATLGGEHAVTNEDGPRRWLDREWPTVGAPMKGEKEVEPLTPDGKLVRINLRPYKQRGGDKEMLLWAFVLSAEKFKGDKSQFIAEWKSLGARLRAANGGLHTFKEWTRVDVEMKQVGYPAIDHSAQYERAYRPAYRVILREFWAD
jgi:hypothetical protein